MEKAQSRVALRRHHAGGCLRIASALGSMGKRTSLVQPGFLFRCARNPGAGCSVLSLASSALLGWGSVVGPHGAVFLFLPALSRAGPSRARPGLAESRLVARLQCSLSLVAVGHQLGRISTRVCQ